MILVDTSVWIDHFDHHEPLLVSLLAEESVSMHPFVLGELAMGSLTNRSATLFMLNQLPLVVSAKDAEVLALVEGKALFGKGIGFIDAHLLASARITPQTQLWTRDKRLQQAAAELSLTYVPV